MADAPKPPGASLPGEPTAGSAPYLWFFSSFMLVLVLDQAGADGTVPAHEDFPLLNLGLAGALVVIWQRKWKVWPAVFLAALASGALRGFGWMGAPAYAVSLIAGALVGRSLLGLGGFDLRLRSVADVLTLAFLAGPAGSFVTAVGMAFLVGTGGSGHPERFLVGFLAQWLAGWTGILMAAPFLFSLSAEYFHRWDAARVREWLLVNLLLLASLMVMMNYLVVGDQLRYPLAYLALPCVFWTAWRFGTAGAALANLFVGTMTALCAKDGLGLFSGEGGMLMLLPAWAFLGFHGLVSLLLAAVTDERRTDLLQQRRRARFMRQLLEELPCGLLLKDRTDRPLLVNRRWFQYFGRADGTEEEQWQHQKAIEPFWRERETHLMQNLGEILREETDSVDYEGRRLELLLTKQAAYFDERGERLLMVVADDVSTGRVSLRLAHAELQRVHETLAVAEVGLWEWHIPTGTIRFDGQFGKLTGLPERLEGLPVQEWQDGIHPADRPIFQNDMLKHLHHQTELFATRFRFRNGDAWVWLVVRGRVVEQDVRKLGIRMIGTLQHARATVTPLPDPNAPGGA
jgi:integral membrane sensor domain MASE1